MVCALQVELEATFGRLRKHAADEQLDEQAGGCLSEVYRVATRDGQLLLTRDSLQCDSRRSL